MKVKIDRMLAYLLARAQEASTWRGIALILTAAGTQVSPEYTEAIIAIGLFAAGMIGAGFPDKAAGQ